MELIIHLEELMYTII